MHKMSGHGRTVKKGMPLIVRIRSRKKTERGDVKHANRIEAEKTAEEGEQTKPRRHAMISLMRNGWKFKQPLIIVVLIVNKDVKAN